jgi:type VI secretion system protein ImpE
VSDLKTVLDSGDLEPAIAKAIAEVKAKPTDAESRYRLFALVAFSGDLHRARRQLKALGIGDEQLERAKAVYINLLAAEQERRAVCHHGAEPLLPPNAPEHLQLRLQALKVTDGQTPESRAAAIEKAIGTQPELSGHLNGQPFSALRDLDDVLGSVLEIFAGGRHVLLPFERIRKLEIEAPGHILDLLWIPARLTDIQGVESSVHIPALYEGSPEAKDPRCTTGAITDWFDQGADVLRGHGQRVLAWQDLEGQIQEMPILAVRNLSFESSE